MDVNTPSLPTPAPWLAEQLQNLLTRQAHALLLEGPSGLGQWELALALAAAWLCEQPSSQGACGQCGSCHLVGVHTHPDLAVLMPEVLMLEMGWALDETSQKKIDDKERKPSKEIRVEALRRVIDFAQTTNARGRGKVVLLYPAEAMNHISANALLKTLEEPVGTVRFILASEAAHQLLPTIRSRCQSHTMHWPDDVQAQEWLVTQNPQAKALLAASGQRPGLALAMADNGLTEPQWAALPQAAALGKAQPFEGMSGVQLVGVLQKICHDLWLTQVGAAPRFFKPADLPASPSPKALHDWTVALKQQAKVAEHPFAAALYAQALLAQAQSAINSGIGLAQIKQGHASK
jgi:DNA polymerase III subunit delta'